MGCGGPPSHIFAPSLAVVPLDLLQGRDLHNAVPYCMRYETEGPNRTVFQQEGGQDAVELVVVCTKCHDALTGMLPDAKQPFTASP